MSNNTFKKIILILTLGLSSFYSYANQNLIDSCLAAIHSYPNDLLDNSFADLLYETGEAFSNEEKYELALPYYLQSLSVSKNNQYSYLIFHNYLRISNAHFWQSEYDNSLFYLHEADNLSKGTYQMTSNDSMVLFSNYGNTYYYIGNINKAYFYRTSALRLINNSNDSLKMADTYYSLAELEKEQEKYSEALEKINFALKIYLNRKRNEDASYCYDMMSTVYFEMEQYSKALEFMTKSCEVKLDDLSSYHEGYCAHGLGEIHLKLKNYSTALNLLKRGLNVREQSGQKEEIIRSKIAIAELYKEVGKCQKSIELLNQCANSHAVANIRPLRRDLFEKIYNVKYKCGNYKSAFEYQQKYFLIRDSIDNDFSKKEIANLSSIHQVEQQKRELQLLQKEKQLSKTYYWIIVATCLVLCGFIILGFWMYKKQYRYNSKLRRQKIKIQNQNQTLFNTNDKLKTANKELESFAYVASHDLKAPLRTISSYVGLLNRKYANSFDENGTEFLNLITDGVDHMSQLLDDVLAYSNIEKNQKPLESIDLNLLFQKVLQTLHANINEKNALISYPDFPMALGNRMQLFQVFQNLLSNALKFIPDGKQPKIEVGIDNNDDMILVQIKDNGIGIEPQYHERIFTIFNRLHTHQEFKGTGIGLSICKKIIEKMGGEIWIESDGENGTTFCFTLQPVVPIVKEKIEELEEMDV